MTTRKRLQWLLLAALLSPPALVRAQAIPNSATYPGPQAAPTFGSVVINPNGGAPCAVGSTGCTLPVSGGVTGTVSIAPYIYTPTGWTSTGSFTAATSITPPANSTVCFIEVEGNAVRYRTDGVAPTANVSGSNGGQLLAPYSTATGGPTLQLSIFPWTNFKAIPITGSASIDYDCYF